MYNIILMLLVIQFLNVGAFDIHFCNTKCAYVHLILNIFNGLQNKEDRKY